jgi:uncharacterized protein
MILIAGGTGLVGLRLSSLLTQKGYEVAHLTRKKNPNSPYTQYLWDVEKQTIEKEAITFATTVINLAGAGIAEKRWTTTRKKEIIESRTKSNLLLKTSFEQYGKPNAYLSASAIGFYGNRGEERLEETSMAGQGDFLSETCIAWENSIQSIEALDIRTVIFRIGIVCSTKGGALPQTMLPIRFGLGTYFGSGQQYYSWIHLNDLCQLFLAAIENKQWEGTYNAVAPNPVSNKVFTQQLIRAMGHYALCLPAPAFLMRVVLGEMAAIILFSSKVSATKVEKMGFVFSYPTLKEALEHLIQEKV